MSFPKWVELTCLDCVCESDCNSKVQEALFIAIEALEFCKDYDLVDEKAKEVLRRIEVLGGNTQPRPQTESELAKRRTKMTFTDDDLKRLKEYHAGRGFYIPTASEAVSLWTLLARLEAAENICEAIALTHKNPICECSICDFLEIWYKAAGK